MTFAAGAEPCVMWTTGLYRKAIFNWLHPRAKAKFGGAHSLLHQEVKPTCDNYHLFKREATGEHPRTHTSPLPLLPPKPSHSPEPFYTLKTLAAAFTACPVAAARGHKLAHQVHTQTQTRRKKKKKKKTIFTVCNRRELENGVEGAAQVGQLV